MHSLSDKYFDQTNTMKCNAILNETSIVYIGVSYVKRIQIIITRNTFRFTLGSSK